MVIQSVMLITQAVGVVRLNMKRDTIKLTRSIDTLAIGAFTKERLACSTKWILAAALLFSVLPAHAGSKAPDPTEVVLAGSFKSVPGMGDWQTDNPHMRMHEQHPGVFELVVHLPAGSYEYKIARGGTWTKNWGAGFSPNGANIPIKVSRISWVRFTVDFKRKLILDSVDNPKQVSSPTGPDPSNGK